MSWTPEEDAEFEDSIEYREGKNEYDDHREYTEDGISGHRKAAAGEFQMAVIFFGGKPDSRQLPGGDKGRDISPLYRWRSQGKIVERFVLTDVKTAYIPNELLVGTADQSDGVRPNTIYILAGYVAPRKAYFRGWQMGHVMAKCEVKDWCNNGRLVHHMLAEELRSMEELKRWYAGQWRHEGHPKYDQPQQADYTMDYEVIKGVLVWKKKLVVPREPLKGKEFKGTCRLCEAPGLYVNTRLRLPEGGFVWECERHRSV